MKICFRGWKDVLIVIDFPELCEDELKVLLTDTLTEVSWKGSNFHVLCDKESLNITITKLKDVKLTTISMALTTKMFIILQKENEQKN